MPLFSLIGIVASISNLRHIQYMKTVINDNLSASKSEFIEFPQ
jgi:hypothetical protein